jgi:hypothetical protein
MNWLSNYESSQKHARRIILFPGNKEDNFCGNGGRKNEGKNAPVANKLKTESTIRT